MKQWTPSLALPPRPSGFEVTVRVEPKPDRTYDITVRLGSHTEQRPCTVATQEQCEILIAILKAVEPLLDIDMKKLHRVPIPRSHSLVAYKGKELVL